MEKEPKTLGDLITYIDKQEPKDIGNAIKYLMLYGFDLEKNSIIDLFLSIYDVIEMTKDGNKPIEELIINEINYQETMENILQEKIAETHKNNKS